MKILLLSDIHENYNSFERIIKNVNFDLLILAGDICEFRCDKFYEIFKEIEVPIVITHGNHDCILCYQKMSKLIKNFHWLHNSVLNIKIGDETLGIAAIGGTFTRKKRDIRRFSIVDVIKLANKLMRNETNIDIFLTHECAKKCSDIIPSTKNLRGGKEVFYLLHVVARPKYHICGHMHYPSAERRGHVICVNPGYGFAGIGAILDTKSGKISFFRIKVKQDLIVEHKKVYSYNWVWNVPRSYNRILKMEAERLVKGFANKTSI